MDKAKILRLCNEINDKIIEFWNCEQIEHDDAQHIISLLDLIGFEVSAKPVTNADRIRQMTDEELAEWFAPHMMCNICDKKNKPIGCNRDECRKYALVYMKQDVEKDA